MDLSPVMQKFVLHWGEMATRWGVSRTVAQIHALLYLSERALRSLLPAASDPEASTSRVGARRLSAEEWLQVLGAARLQRRPAIGLGDDFELAAVGLIGSGVWLDGHPAHLSAFAPA